MNFRSPQKLDGQNISGDKTLDYFERVNDKVSTDFYEKNYEKILDYFGNKSDVVKFYERIKTLNSMVYLMKEDEEKGIKYYEGYLITYLGQLMNALNEGKNFLD